MAFCLKIGKPLISLGAWDISDKIIKAENPQDAVKRAIKSAGEIK